MTRSGKLSPDRVRKGIYWGSDRTKNVYTVESDGEIITGANVKFYEAVNRGGFVPARAELRDAQEVVASGDVCAMGQTHPTTVLLARDVDLCATSEVGPDNEVDFGAVIDAEFGKHYRRAKPSFRAATPTDWETFRC